MVNLEPHHRRIHNKARLIHFGLIPLALVVPFLWIYFAYGICQEAESPFRIRLCAVFQYVPLFPALLGSFVLGLIVWDLVRIGIMHHEETQGIRVKRPQVKHAIHGYHAIDDHHRRHIHLAVGLVISVSLALIAWQLFEGHHSTH